MVFTPTIFIYPYNIREFSQCNVGAILSINSERTYSNTAGENAGANIEISRLAVDLPIKINNDQVGISLEVNALHHVFLGNLIDQFHKFIGLYDQVNDHPELAPFIYANNYNYISEPGIYFSNPNIYLSHKTKENLFQISLSLPFFNTAILDSSSSQISIYAKHYTGRFAFGFDAGLPLDNFDSFTNFHLSPHFDYFLAAEIYKNVSASVSLSTSPVSNLGLISHNSIKLLINFGSVAFQEDVRGISPDFALSYSTFNSIESNICE